VAEEGGREAEGGRRPDGRARDRGSRRPTGAAGPVPVPVPHVLPRHALDTFERNLAAEVPGGDSPGVDAEGS